MDDILATHPAPWARDAFGGLVWDKNREIVATCGNDFSSYGTERRLAACFAAMPCAFAALKRIARCPAMSMDELEPEDRAALADAEAAIAMLEDHGHG